VGIDDLPEKTMASFPRHLVKEAMLLPGVPSEKEVKACVKHGWWKSSCTLSINHKLFDKRAYESIRTQILQHFADHMLTKQLGPHILGTLAPQQVAVMDNPKYRLTNSEVLQKRETMDMDYMRDMTCIALLEMGVELHTNFDIEYLFEDTPIDTSKLYGRGINIARTLPPALRSLYHPPSSHPDPNQPEGCDAVVLLTASNDVGATSTQPKQVPYIVIDGNDIRGWHPKPRPSAHVHFIREYGDVLRSA
jgi:hypothetical protein